MGPNEPSQFRFQFALDESDPRRGSRRDRKRSRPAVNRHIFRRPFEFLAEVIEWLANNMNVVVVVDVVALAEWALM